MDAIQIARYRKTMGQSVDQLAEDMGVRAATIVAWETGEKAIPRKHARHLEWLVAVSERESALDRSGLPECEWVKQWSASGSSSDVTVELERLQALESHSAQCPACQARAQFLQTKLPPMPDLPMGWGMRLFGSVADTYERIRGWHRPLGIALFISALLGVARFIAFAPRSTPFEILTYLLALALAATSSLELYYGLKFLHGSAIGRWVARSVSGITAMIGFGSVFMLAGFSDSFSREGDMSSWGDILVMGVFIGLAYATLWPLVSAIQAAKD